MGEARLHKALPQPNPGQGSWEPLGLVALAWRAKSGAGGRGRESWTTFSLLLPVLCSSWARAGPTLQAKRPQSHVPDGSPLLVSRPPPPS